jgi:hypothetical protein
MQILCANSFIKPIKLKVRIDLVCVEGKGEKSTSNVEAFDLASGAGNTAEDFEVRCRDHRRKRLARKHGGKSFRMKRKIARITFLL